MFVNMLNSMYFVNKSSIMPVIAGPAVYSNPQTVGILAGWVAGGDGTNKIIRSSDGLSWSASSNSSFSSSCDSVAYGVDINGNKKWVGVGSGGSLVGYSSNNGNTWVAGAPNTIFGTYGRDVIYGKDASNNPIWYGVGANLVPLAYSYNGINWVSKGSTIAGINILRGISYGNNQYLALGNNGINLSTDYGNSWTNVSSLTNQGRDAAYGIDINGVGRWIAVGTGTSLIATSTNGTNWSAITGASTYISQGYTVAYGNDANGNYRWVIGGTGGQKLVYTNDCVTFTTCSGISSITTVNGVTCGKTTDGSPLWIAVGAGTDNILKSTDGITWSSLTNKTSLFTSSGLGVCYGEDIYDKPTYLMYTPGSSVLKGSTDQINYITLLSPFSVSINSLVWNGSMWVGGGEGGNTLASSVNGVIWNGKGTTVFSVKCTKVEWNEVELKWYAYGIGTNNSAYSSNGIDWTPF